MNRRLSLLLVPLVAAVVLFPRATPRPAPLTTSIPVEVSAGRTGAPQTETMPSMGPSPRASGAPTPRPSGGIDKGFYCSEPTCGYVEPTAKPQPLTVKASGGIVGTATYYCRPGISRCTRGYPQGMYAAAGPELRAMLGPDWRGRTVVVIDANGRGVLVQLIDFCACGGDHVIDLYWTAYQGLVNPVTVKENP